MAEHMVIAPGESVDRRWVDTGYKLLWMPRPVFTTFELYDPLEDWPQPLRATLHTYHHPAWKVRLRFYVDDRLGLVSPEIPYGYVLPGLVHGEHLERDCLFCRRPAPCRCGVPENGTWPW